MLISKAGGRGILSHRLSEYVFDRLAVGFDFRSGNRTTGIKVTQLAFDVGLQT
jgi:hypothetical protein